MMPEQKIESDEERAARAAAMQAFLNKQGRPFALNAFARALWIASRDYQARQSEAQIAALTAERDAALQDVERLRAALQHVESTLETSR